MNGNVLPAIPENIRSSIIPVKKKQNAYDTDRYECEQMTEDRIWIPSSDEVFGERSLYYGLFQNQSAERVRTLGGSAAWWWLRSAFSGNYASDVNSDGSSYGHTVHNTSGGVVVGFCL